MRYLIISYDFPPVNSPRAFRWGTIAQYLASQGHTVDVITHCNKEATKLVDNVTVYPVQEFLLNYLNSFKNIKEISQDSNSITQWKYVFQKYTLIAGRWMYHNIWKNIYWPDAYTTWIPFAISSAKKMIKENKYDAVITVSLPFTCHAIGLKLKKEFPDIFWMADMGEPFSLSTTRINNIDLYDSYNRRAEQDVFDISNVISVTNNETKQKYSPWLPPESFDKIKVMPLLFTPIEKAVKYDKSNDVIKLFYCGTLYKTICNPAFLLQVFSTIAQQKFNGKTLELHIMGDITDTLEYFKQYENLIDKQVFLHGWKSKEDVNSMMASSDILINICNDTFYQLPCKVIEYAASGKPVLNFAKSNKDSSIHFFEEYGNSSTINQSDGLDAAIEKLCIFLKLPLNDLTAKQTEGFLKPYLAESVCKQYLEALPHDEEYNEQTG